MREESAPPDRIVATIATRQYGIVSTRQLLTAGVGKDGILRRVRAGRLHRIYRGVYAVGHVRLSEEGRWTAALLACGGDAVISHRSAAALWGLLPRDAGAAVDVSLPGRAGRRGHQGIHIHRPSTLTSRLVTLRRGIAVTNPTRTIADLHRAVSPAEARRAIRQAEVLGLVLGADVGQDGTRSELERRFLALCRRRRLPAPEVNARVGSRLVDFLWRDRRLIVETDGYRYHRGRFAFEDDRARDLELRALGYEVIRLSYRQVTESPAQVASVLGDALVQRQGA
jgi:very-short-patch-repair endonuclease